MSRKDGDQSAAARTLQDSDWDFSGVASDQAMAASYFEYARESPSIVAHYDSAQPIPGLPVGWSYVAEVDGRRLRVINPLLWPWINAWGIKFSETPWSSLGDEYREMVSHNFLNKRMRLREPVKAADSQMMAADTISRGWVCRSGNWEPSRDGVDESTGIERVALELDWGSYTDAEIATALRKWVGKNRPPGIGVKHKKGRALTAPWLARLRRLGVMRILHYSPLSQLPKAHPRAWQWLVSDRNSRETIRTYEDLYSTSLERQIYREREGAAEDFRRLFPFLPVSESPISF